MNQANLGSPNLGVKDVDLSSHNIASISMAYMLYYNLEVNGMTNLAHETPLFAPWEIGNYSFYLYLLYG